MPGLLLRLAGPLQSWGEHSTFSTRDTGRFPTRSGMVGLLANALGRRRTEPISDLAALRFTIRIDRDGEPMVDFHTVGGGLPRDRTVPTASGKRRERDATTIVSNRHYLADAVFMIAIEGPDDLVSTVGEALRRPHWAPYLGRRSCPAETPLLVQTGVDNPARDLCERVPLARRRPADTAHVSVSFVNEQPVDGPGQSARVELNDIPVSFDPLRRRYTGRAAFVTAQTLPATLCAGVGRDYLSALTAYLQVGKDEST